MGKIKSKLVRRTAHSLIRGGLEFSPDFNSNKKIIGGNTMPSKKLRNQIAGFLARTKKQELQKAQKNLKR